MDRLAREYHRCIQRKYILNFKKELDGRGLFPKTITNFYTSKEEYITLIFPYYKTKREIIIVFDIIKNIKDRLINIPYYYDTNGIANYTYTAITITNEEFFSIYHNLVDKNITSIEQMYRKNLNGKSYRSPYYKVNLPLELNDKINLIKNNLLDRNTLFQYIFSIDQTNPEEAALYLIAKTNRKESVPSISNMVNTLQKELNFPNLPISYFIGKKDIVYQFNIPTEYIDTLYVYFRLMILSKPV